jgi:hypothetical protein
MLDGALVRNQIIARGLSAACAGPTPPTWLAGSFATLSPSHAYLYALFGASRLPSDIFGETAAGRLQVGLFQANGSASVEAITVLRAGTGDVRLRIPITRAMAVTTIGLPLGRIAGEGVLEGIVIQTGHTVAAAANAKPIRIDEGRLVFAAGIEGNGRHYRALDDDGCLMIPIDRFEHDVAIYTIVLRSLSGASVTADHGDNSGSGER